MPNQGFHQYLCQQSNQNNLLLIPNLIPFLNEEELQSAPAHVYLLRPNTTLDGPFCSSHFHLHFQQPSPIRLGHDGPVDKVDVNEIPVDKVDINESSQFNKLSPLSIGIF